MSTDSMLSKKLTPLQMHLRLNDAHYFEGRFYYKHSLKDLGRLVRSHSRTRFHWLAKIADKSGKALERIEAMIASRTGRALARCSLPKKQQRLMGLLRAV